MVGKALTLGGAPCRCRRSHRAELGPHSVARQLLQTWRNWSLQSGCSRSEELTRASAGVGQQAGGQLTCSGGPVCAGKLVTRQSRVRPLQEQTRQAQAAGSALERVPSCFAGVFPCSEHDCGNASSSRSRALLPTVLPGDPRKGRSRVAQRQLTLTPLPNILRRQVFKASGQRTVSWQILVQE